MTTNRIVVTGLFLVLVLVGLQSLIGQTQSRPPAGKIVVVHPEVVLQGTEEGKQEMAKLQQFGQAKQQQLSTQGNELQSLRDRYAQLPATTQATVRTQLERDIQEREVKLKRLQEDIQGEMNQQQSNAMMKMIEKLQQALDEYAQKNQIDIILRLDQGGVAYVNPAINVTNDVIKLYNQKFPVAGAAAPAATPAPTTPPTTPPATPPATPRRP